DDADRFVVVGVSGGPEHHGAERVGTDLDAGPAKGAVLHVVSPGSVVEGRFRALTEAEHLLAEHATEALVTSWYLRFHAERGWTGVPRRLPHPSGGRHRLRQMGRVRALRSQPPTAQARGARRPHRRHLA